MVIDDEYSDIREDMYQNFLSKDYDGVDISFDILPVEYGRVLNEMIESKIQSIDAFFIDARLDSVDKGWGQPNFGIQFSGVLSIIEKLFGDHKVPPIFMISKHWTDEEFLTSVSKSFSVFHKSVQPSRFFSLIELEKCVRAAKEKNAHGVLEVRHLDIERKYIQKEIEKVKKERYNAGIPIDIVVIVAIPEEKKMAYKAFNIDGATEVYMKGYGFSYCLAQKDGYNIAIITQLTMGMANASVTTTSAIFAFRPKLVAMVGICAGKKDKTKVCDIVVPSEVLDYSIGKKYKEKIEYRPLHQTIKPDIFDYVQHRIANNNLLFARIEESFSGETPEHKMSAHTQPMATGTWIVDDPNVFDKITTDIQGNCIALDMEAYAVALAAQHLDVAWMVIKSVQDYADGKKNETEGDYRKYAAYSSARVLYECLPEIMKRI